uniref:GCS light chain n=1 Tax=Cacopsylla melanoneura TaxID=428564 RepID=A0A8D8Q022_9HEMI
MMTYVQIHTGNILNLPELKLQTADKEFSESIRITLEEKYGKESEKIEDEIAKLSSSSILEINRGSPFATVSADDIKNSRTSVKIFVKSCEPEHLQQAIDYIFKYLEIQTVDTVILAYNDSRNKEKSQEKLLSELNTLWTVLETMVDDKKISRIGVSDLHEDTFIQFYSTAKVKPSMIQINLSSCCVVPPVLQEFAKSNVIQLITHSDPIDILNQTPVLSKTKNVSLLWAGKYQTHVVCRGVLVSKGYIVCTQVKSE